MKEKESWKQSIIINKNNSKYIHKITFPKYKYYIEKYSNGLLADIGCGNVPYYNLYKEKVDNNICIDYNKSLKHVDIITNLNESLNIENNLFDTILCTDVLEHIKNPNILFSEMSRILKNNGYLILTVPFYYWIHEDPYDYNRYTKYMLEEFCYKNKFKIIEFDIYGGIPEIIADITIKGYANLHLPLFLKVFVKVCMILGKWLSNRKFVHTISKQSKDKFPLGYILVAKKEEL